MTERQMAAAEKNVEIQLTRDRDEMPGSLALC